MTIFLGGGIIKKNPRTGVCLWRISPIWRCKGDIMNTKILLDPIKQTKEYIALTDRLNEMYKDNANLPLLVNGVSGGAAFALIYSLISHIKSGYKKTALVPSASIFWIGIPPRPSREISSPVFPNILYSTISLLYAK